MRKAVAAAVPWCRLLPRTALTPLGACFVVLPFFVGCPFKLLVPERGGEGTRHRFCWGMVATNSRSQMHLASQERWCLTASASEIYSSTCFANSEIGSSPISLACQSSASCLRIDMWLAIPKRTLWYTSWRASCQHGFCVVCAHKSSPKPLPTSKKHHTRPKRWDL